MYSVDIDTGGTMTDCLVAAPDRTVSLKVDTTPHDYTVSFGQCLKEAAAALGFAGASEFLEQVKLIRWSTTISSNVLGERRGAKVGVLVEQGGETSLYGPGPSPALGWLVAAKNAIGLPRNPGEQEILAGVKRLLEDGVRRICVCLQGAYPDNTAERTVAKVIDRHYPDHYLGSVPVLLGSEMAQVGDDNTRAHYSLMNAYTHAQLATSLFKADDILKQELRWDGPLLIGHANGGVARVGKTKAVDTIESGPIFGTFGGAYLARQYGLDGAICLDVGGTTTKASMVRGGEPLYRHGGELVGLPVKTRFAMLRSAVLGGGSIAGVNNGALSLGPESMGAAPGPACYGLGGREATLTDALLVLGYLDAKGFMGGRRELRIDLSERVIAAQLAKPLGIPVREAAQQILARALRIMAGLVGAALDEGGLAAADAVLIAYGGNGPLFAALVARELGIRRVVVPKLAPVFSTFGSSIADLVHVYEMGLGIDPKRDEARLLAALERMLDQARRDIQGEGFDARGAALRLEAEAHGAAGAPVLNAAEAAGAATATELLAALAQRGLPARIDLLRLAARLGVGAALPKPIAVGAAKRPVVTEMRTIRLNGADTEARVYSWDTLAPGDAVQGPALVSGGNMTCLVPETMGLTVDGYGNARIDAV